MTARWPSTISNDAGLEQQGQRAPDLKRYEEALAAYEHALALDPNDAVAWNGKGIALYEPEALPRRRWPPMSRRWPSTPTMPFAWNNKGNALYDLQALRGGAGRAMTGRWPSTPTSPSPGTTRASRSTA